MKLLDDVNYLRSFAPAIKALRSVSPTAERTVADVLEDVVDEHADRTSLISGDRSITYAELDAQANRVASHFHVQGVGAGDVVAIDMENRIEYVTTWLGLAKLGATSALINTNLSHHQLAHCINVAKPSHVVVGAELAERFDSARADLEGSPTIWSQGGEVAGAASLDDAVADASDLRPHAKTRAGLTLGGTKLFYIYTSGTTGLPKAAVFSHLRWVQGGHAFAGACKLTPDDRHYLCLPLYHTAGGCIALGATLETGASAYLVPKFSVSRFWPEVVASESTAFQYIGELMRYLVNAEPVPEEQQHKLRVATGNGLRPELWDAVLNRFGIDRVVEFYGATEGNVAFMNFDNKVGSVGRMPGFVRKAMGIKLVKYDVENDEIVRGDDGFCIECGPNEPGEAIGKIPKKKNAPTGRFEGYSDEEATKKKILRDAFEPGDEYFRTGDLLRMDEAEYFYFVDRIGDTFRWKGENVATTEVAEVIAVLDGVEEVNVYGVAIPNTDGRAGMASIVPTGDALDLDELYAATESELASYARPVFVRLQPEMEITGTFKHRKVDLVKDGYDPSKIGEAVYFRDTEAGAYVPVDQALFDKINAGEVRI